MSSKPSDPKKTGELVDAPVDAASVLERFGNWFPELSSEIISKLGMIHTELLSHSKTSSLVPGPSLKTADTSHIYDCVQAAKLISAAMIPNAPLYDLGTANGLPGLVLAATSPKSSVVIVERDSKKIEFIKAVIAAGKLSNATLKTAAIDELPPGSVMNALVRGPATLPKVLLAIRKPIGKGGKLFHLKGDAWANELAGVPSQLFSVWSPSLLGQYKLPGATADMAVVLTDKISD